MKGRSSNTCRANGGSTMRNIGGVKAPSYGSEPSVMKAAEGKTTGIVDMDGPGGGSAKTRLDRPGRKHGGKVEHKAKGHHEKKEHHEDHKKDSGKTLHFLEGIKKGALRSELHVKEGEKIPEKKLEKAEKSDNPLTKKRAVLAENMKNFKHGKG